jgi:hypothetical protein
VTRGWQEAGLKCEMFGWGGGWRAEDRGESCKRRKRLKDSEGYRRPPKLEFEFRGS